MTDQWVLVLQEIQHDKQARIFVEVHLLLLGLVVLVGVLGLLDDLLVGQPPEGREPTDRIVLELDGAGVELGADHIDEYAREVLLDRDEKGDDLLLVVLEV